MYYNYHPDLLMSLPPQTLMWSSGLISVACLILYSIEAKLNPNKGNIDDDPFLPPGQALPAMGCISLVGFIGFGVLFVMALVDYLGW